VQLTKKSIVRQDFLKRFVATGGIKYEDAAKIYDAMSELFADAITTGQKISIGRVLSIKPVKRKARSVKMGFRGTKKTIYLSDRITFKVSVFREFLRTHELRWTL
jgi:nucleoid DNA-binding protein